VRICRQIARAFGWIHQHGIVHGDVHPGNVLVDRQDRVRLIDFGLAQFTAGAGPAESGIERGGVTLFLEPELARCLLADEPLPPATPAGEQYAVAALMYQLLTGFPYLDFSLERQALLRQIVSAPPVSFQDRGLVPWPQVEALLARALAKEPARRFPSLGALAERLATVSLPPAQRYSAARDDDLKQLPDPVFDQTSLDGLRLSNGLEPPLSASLFFGAAGIAYAIYRVAFLRQQPELLAGADTWLDRAESTCDPAAAPPDPFPGADPKPGHGADRMDPASPFHATSGVHAVRAMVASAGNRPAQHAKAVEAWLAATRRPSFNSKPPSPDLATGRAGSLLAAALLTEAWLPSSPIELAQVTELGNRIHDELWSSLAEEPIVSETLGQIGMAHGWAGLLYASLRWRETTASDLPTETERRLHELAGLAQPAGRGLIWPWELPWRECNQPDFMAGWCAGSAGYALLFALANDCFPRAHFADVALGAGWNAWESSQREGSLCCGLAGRACAMLRLHQMTGDAVWLDRAHDLAQLAAAEGRFDQTLPHSLYKGRLGLELLAVELEHPLRGRFPFF
jgi:serine/threonine-protein kinase